MQRFNFTLSAPVYSMEDCIRVVQSFHAEYGRVPTIEDITYLSKKGKSPSSRVFAKKGGLNWIIEKAGLEPVNKRRTYYAGEALREFLTFMKDFKKENERLPTLRECRDAAKIGKCPYEKTLKKDTGRNFNQTLLGIGG